jgi:acyl-CoA thioester hydrolase
VYHGAYLDFFERARTEWLRHLGFEQAQLISRFGVMFIVRTLDVKYMRPARLDDLIDVSVDVCRLGRAQVTLAQEVRKREESLVRANVNLACVSAGEFRPQPLPEAIGAAFSGITGTTTNKRNAKQ